MSNRDTETEVGSNAEYDRNPNERGKWLSAIIGLLGTWMLVEAVWFNVVPGQFWNDIIVGALLLAVGGYNYYRRGNDEIGSVSAAALAALVGLWLLAAPFLFGTDAAGAAEATGLAFWNDIIVGLIALGAGAYSAYAAHDQQQKATETVTGR